MLIENGKNIWYPFWNRIFFSAWETSPSYFFLSDFGRLQKDSIFLLLKEAKSWKLVQLARHAHVHVHSQFQEAKSALVYSFWNS